MGLIQLGTCRLDVLDKLQRSQISAILVMHAKYGSLYDSSKISENSDI